MSNPTSSLPKRIPYGVADYGRLRRENAYYVDKTHYIPIIEAAPFYLFCIRPRRFGKSLWLSVLQHYYDVNQADNFNLLFGDTYVGHNPTPDHNSYLILFFNFALVNPAIDKVEASFETNGSDEIDSFLRCYQRFFAEAEVQHISAAPNVEAKLRRLFIYSTEKKLKIYLLIDEYDNFTNTILTTDGQQAYHNLTHGSGFNIGTNISMDSRFNEMIGFTEAEVQTILGAYAGYGLLPLGVENSLQLMQVWYNNYRFGQRAATSMYNSDMVLNMAYRGEWRPFFDYLNEQIRQQASVRDHLHGEKVLQGFLIAYLNVTHSFLTWSEQEMGGGFVNLYLEPFLARYPDIKYGYLIELEYISDSQFNKRDFDQSLAKEKAEAETQLHQYAQDARIAEVAKQVTLKKLVLIYKGWELVYPDEV